MARASGLIVYVGMAGERRGRVFVAVLLSMPVAKLLSAGLVKLLSIAHLRTQDGCGIALLRSMLVCRLPRKAGLELRSSLWILKSAGPVLPIVKRPLCWSAR